MSAVDTVPDVAADEVLRQAGVRLRYFRFSPDSCTRQLLLLEGRHKAGWLNFDFCHGCRRGHVWKLTIDDEIQRQGVGSHMLAVARDLVPGYRWTTSGQYADAKGFWKEVGRASRAGYEAQSPCAHMENDIKGWRRKVEVWRFRPTDEVGEAQRHRPQRSRG